MSSSSTSSSASTSSTNNNNTITNHPTSTTPTPTNSTAVNLNNSNQPASKKIRYDSPTGNSSPSSRPSSSNLLMQQQQQQRSTTPQSQSRPLVALLDGRDCSVEMPILKDIATVAFCDAQSTNEIHEKVLNEAQAALLYNTINLNKEDLLKFKALKLIVRIGVEYDNIDIKAAADLNIAVCNVNGYCVEEVADSTLSMILNLYRRTHFLSQSVQQKLATSKQLILNNSSASAVSSLLLNLSPSTPEQTREVGQGCVRVRGQILGLIGFGKCGIAVAQRARSFGFKVIFYDPNIGEGFEKAIGGDVTRCFSLSELLQQSDCISLHATLTDTSYQILNEQTFKSIKQGAFLVNTSQASLVDECALASALKSGLLKAAAIDVFHNDAFNPINGTLKDAPNLLVTPNVSFYSEISSREMREMAAHEVRRGLLNKMPASLRNCVNKDLLISSNNNGSLSNGNNSNNTNNNGSMNSNGNNNFNVNVNSNHNNNRGVIGGISSPPSNPTPSAASPMLNPAMMAAAAAAASNPLSAASLLQSSSNPNAQLLAQLSCKFSF
jgi:C-terminal binding protein